MDTMDTSDTLDASYCHCGQIMVPPKKRCIFCLKNTVPMVISNMGKLLSFTNLNITQEGINEPLIIGFVEMVGQMDTLKKKNNLKEKPKLICRGMSGRTSEEDLKIGLNVEIEKRDNIYFFTVVK